MFATKCGAGQLSPHEAFLLAAELKYSPLPPRLYASAKHEESALQHGWMDRVLRSRAILQLSGSPYTTQGELERLSGHAALVDAMRQEERQIEELMASGRKERAEGFLVCKNPSCKSKEIDVEQKQTRSADEPMSLFCLCVKCGNRWTMK